jgi:hypothetical protein
VNQVLLALLSTGGAAFLTALIMGVRSLREGKIAGEESIIKRLNEDAKQAHDDAEVQRMRAIRAESEREEMRRQRDIANEEVARMRMRLIQEKVEPPAPTA